MGNLRFFWVLVLLYSCSETNETVTRSTLNEYADLFSIRDKTIETYDDQGAIRCRFDIKPEKTKRIILLNSTHLGFLRELNELGRVVGIVEKFRLPSPYDSLLSSVREVGSGGVIDLEQILLCEPDLIICNAFQRTELKRLQDAGIAVLEVNEYNEAHPLAIPEYFKLFGTLLDLEEKSNQIYIERVARYEELKGTHHPLNIGSIYRFGNKFFSAPCGGRQVKMMSHLGLNHICFGNSTLSQEITKEQLLLMLQDVDALFYLDWKIRTEVKSTSELRLLVLDDLLGDFPSVNYKGVIIYCNAKEAGYYEELMMDPGLLLQAFSNRLDGQHTPFFVKL